VALQRAYKRVWETSRLEVCSLVRNPLQWEVLFLLLVPLRLQDSEVWLAQVSLLLLSLLLVSLLLFKMRQQSLKLSRFFEALVILISFNSFLPRTPLDMVA
jgi:predicted ABC-type exoprotein transport system permease subunit